MKATRLPGKPLAMIGGKPMIEHVYARAAESGLGPVYVAAAEEEIKSAVEKAGGKAVLTDPSLPSGSDRVWAALRQIDPEGKFLAVINVQGDQPNLSPQIIRALAEALENADIATPVAEITDQAEMANPNVVKAVVAANGKALYFTRNPAPHGEGPFYHHIGIYAYRREALQKFVNLPPSPLEKRERLEQLRALENGFSIAAIIVNEIPQSVDTEEDLEKARILMKL